MEIRAPVDVATRHTAAFIAPLVGTGSTLLEIGCGRGDLAAELMRRGCRIIAIDADEESVAAARARGVAATRAEWPQDDGPSVDAIAFTRSLHHIGPLDAAIAQARRRLQAGGVLIVEDFAFDDADPDALRWFAATIRSRRSLHDTSRSDHGPPRLIGALLEAADPTTAWHNYHTHEHRLHPPAAMRRAIGEHFTVVSEARVPYLYRYLVPVLPATETAAVDVETVFRDEAAAVGARRFTPVGWRLIAKAQPAAALRDR